MPMSPQFHVYHDGSVQLVDARVSEPISFAHIGDLHLPPHSLDNAPPQYHSAIQWWDTAFRYPHQALPKLLDDICAHDVDFLFLGGDIFDYYDPETVQLVIDMCKDRNLPAYFQIGNHDWEDEYIRYVTHECDYEVRAVRGKQLMQQWGMPGLYYSFERNGVRFVSLDTPYIQLDNDYAGVFDAAQVDWFVDQLSYDGPIVVLHHVPFNRPTLEHRLRAVWEGFVACVREDDNGRRVLAAIEACPNVLSTFTAHQHFRSEDALGRVFQFMVAPGFEGQWRYVKIDSTTPPKSLRIPGRPVADLDLQSS